jgi:hypothetical protein
MRATSMRRLLGGAASLLLIGATLLTTAGVVTAGETRILDIRSPGQVTPVLSFTGVSAGNVTKTDIVVSNNGKQTLTSAHLLIGLAPASTLASDVTIAATFGAAGSMTCTKTSTTLDCDLGSLTAKGPGKTRSISVAFTIGNSGSHTIDAAVKVAEAVQDVGSNANFSKAAGTFSADAASCDKAGTFLPPGVTGSVLPVAADCSADDQRSALAFTENVGGALVTVDDSQTPTSCPTGYKCFGKEVSATVNGGATVSPYLIWLITYSADTAASLNLKQVAFQHGDYIIGAGKKGACDPDFTKFTNDCNAGFTVNSDGSVTFELHTGSNSVMKGLG